MKVRLDQFKEKNVIRMKQGWFDICSVRPDIKISSKELRTRLKLNSMKEYLQNGRLQWLDYLERMEELNLLNVEPRRLLVFLIVDKLEKHERGNRK